MLVKLNFFLPFLFPFSYLFSAVVDLLMGLLPVLEFLRKPHRDKYGTFYSSLSLKLLSICIHKPGSIYTITLTWVSFEDLEDPPPELKYT